MNVEIVKTEFKHVREICETMRERERDAFAQLKDSPEHLITQEVARSLISFTGMVDGRCVIVCGARCDGVFDDSAYLWIVATQLLDKYPVTFLRHSRRGLDLLRANFTHLHGLVLADFGCSVRWLEWLGFKVNEPLNGVRAFELRQI